MTAETVVQVSNLHVRFPRENVHAVRGVSFELRRGEVLAIVGESGSGKSVTARTLLGLAGAGAEVTADSLRVEGEDILNLSKAQWNGFRGRRIGLVSQDALVSLDPLRTVGSEVSEAACTHKLIAKQQRQSHAVDKLTQVNVPDPEERESQYPHELSGGLRQRALIAAGMSADPPILILDEPTTALDVTTQARILDLLRHTREELGVSMLFISHDLTVVRALADRVLVMRHGELVEEGPCDEVLTSPQHPYTKRLLSSVPVGVPKGVRLLDEKRLADPDAIPAAPRANPFATDEIVLEGRGLTRVYQRPGGGVRYAAQNVDFELRRGHTLGIVGESGSGKTTVSRMALALLQPTEGEALLFGERWSTLRLRDRQRLRGRIQMIAQDPLGSFDPRYTVRQLLHEPLRLFFGNDSREHDQRIERLLREVGLDPAIVSRRPLQLSGGQRQRLAIARALAPEPEILVCDEPVSALDVSVQAQVLDLLAELQEQRGLSMLFISHDLGVIQHVSDHIMVMRDGEVVERGTVKQVTEAPQHPYTKELLTALTPTGGA